ncbi:MAG: O-antigen ligase family protein [Azoarcus sp.]|jgi:O-antigen ligase|nr:O-antigen ligase family protein [Azoarcus sp.]
MQKHLYKWMPICFLIYLPTWFFLRTSQQETFFYFLIALPTLFLSTRLYQLLRNDTRTIVSLILFLVYFSFSSFWGEREFNKAIKSGVLLLCLLLAVETTVHRFNTKFLANFITIIGGAAICTHGFVSLLSNTEFSNIMSNRFSLDTTYGWGRSNPIDSAIILGLPIISAWWLFPMKNWSLRTLLLLLIICGTILIFFTQSRGPILALGATLLIVTLIRKDRSDIVLMLSGCILFVILFFFTNIDEHINTRISTPDYRIHIWKESIAQFLAHFWIGQGFGHNANIPISPDWTAGHAHSFVLEIIRVGGIIGASLFCIMLFFMLNRFIFTSAGFFFLLWLIFGTLCLLTNGRLLLTYPWRIECFAFWIPLLCLHFSSPSRINDIAPPGLPPNWSTR